MITLAYILLILAGAFLLYRTFRADDRRYIYLAVAIYVAFPVIVNISRPMDISPESRQLFNAVDSLPDSSVVLLTFDYYPSTVAETEPMSRAALHHLFRKDCRVVTMTTVPLGGASMAERVTRDLAGDYGKIYGVDYINLGFKANYVAILKGMGSSIRSIYPADNGGTPLDSFPIMKNIDKYDDMAFVFCVADNAVVEYWMSIVKAQYGISIGSGMTAVMAPKLYAYVGSGQLTGLLGGMKGAADYEKLLGYEGMATKGMPAQSLIHIFIIFSVIVGNIIFLYQRKKRENRGQV